MHESDCPTRHDIERWLAIQEDNTRYCPHCMSVLKRLKTGGLTCQNDMCRFEETIIEAGNDEDWCGFIDGLPLHLKERYRKW